MDTILIIEDDKEMSIMLKNFLKLKKIKTKTLENGLDIEKHIDDNVSLILLDINMPKVDGFQVCKRIRKSFNMPIIFITAMTSEDDKIKGLMLGGDDYITKPFSLEELYARIYTNLNRSRRIKNKSGLSINYSLREIYYDEEKIFFTKIEFDILELISTNKSKIFEKEEIYTKLWGLDALGDNMVVSEHIRKIRNKLSKVTDKNYIETVWGVGYKWNG